MTDTTAARKWLEEATKDIEYLPEPPTIRHIRHLLTDRDALVRYIRAEDALANLKQIRGVMDLAKEAIEAYGALSQELRDELSKEL